MMDRELRPTGSAPGDCVPSADVDRLREALYEARSERDQLRPLVAFALTVEEAAGLLYGIEQAPGYWVMSYAPESLQAKLHRIVAAEPGAEVEA